MKKFIRNIKKLGTPNGQTPRKAVTSPHHFTARDWHYVFVETRLGLKEKKTAILAAGIAFFAGLAFFTMVAASIAIVAYTLNVDQLNTVLKAIEIYFPIDIAALLGSQLQTAIEYNLSNVAVAVVAIVIGLYSASRAIYMLISAINTAYEKKEKRHPFVLMGLSFVMALGALVMAALVISLILIDVPALLHLGVPPVVMFFVPIIRWLLLAVIIAITLAVLYRVAPSQHNPHWQWVSWGAAIASVIWLAGTSLFFLYAKSIMLYSSIYNVIGSVIVLFIWLNLSAYIILLGAEINHRLEQRTTRRTSK